jgi:hypothetical protein
LSFPFDPEQSYRHDIELLTFQLRSLREILAEIEENSSFFSGSSSIPLTAEQLRIAERIDEHTNRVLPEDGGSEKEYEEFPASMHEYLGDFKRLMAISSKDQMSELCGRYDGFYRFAKCLEEIAQGLSDGSIPRM